MVAITKIQNLMHNWFWLTQKLSIVVSIKTTFENENWLWEVGRNILKLFFEG